MISCFVRIDGYAGVFEFEAEEDTKTGDRVVCEIDKGACLGTVISNPSPATRESLKKILKKATEEEIAGYRALKEKERYAFDFCKKKIADTGLSMKLLNAEYLYGGTKLLFYFVSESRVDFRELVKELAKEFKMRIELRQVGVRDESKMIGGVGNCGNVVCCRRFLNNFSIVSIKMVKEQGLALNPSKISGVCGRLMCCLSYEHEMYSEYKKGFPKIGKRVLTKQGEGKVTKHNTLQGSFVLELDDGKHVTVTAKDVVRNAEKITSGGPDETGNNKKEQKVQKSPEKKHE